MWNVQLLVLEAPLEYTFASAAQALDFVEVGVICRRSLPSQKRP